jgi:hypothetical protein
MSDVDPTPATPTTLGDRLAWLRGDMSAQFTTLGDKIDALGIKLDAIHTALTSASGNIDAAPIVAAIQALAGPAPGKTLTDLHTLTTTIKNNIGLPTGDATTTLLGLLAQVNLISTTIKNNIGLPTGDATTTLLGLLAQVNFALTHPDSNNATIYAKIHSIMNTLILPASIDDTVLGELEAIRTGQLSIINQNNPTSIVPVGLCATPLQSSGVDYRSGGFSVGAGGIGGSITYEITLASWNIADIIAWPGQATYGMTLTDDPAISTYGILATNGWESLKIYVASKAPFFGCLIGSSQRFQTNTWHVLAGTDTFRFFVEGSNNIRVSICPVNDTPTGYVWETTDTEAVTTGAGIRYMWKTTKYPSLDFQQIGINPRILVGDWGGWGWIVTGTSIYVVGWNGDTTVIEGAIQNGTFPPGTNRIICQSDNNLLRIELFPPI